MACCSGCSDADPGAPWILEQFTDCCTGSGCSPYILIAGAEFPDEDANQQYEWFELGNTYGGVDYPGYTVEKDYHDTWTLYLDGGPTSYSASSAGGPCPYNKSWSGLSVTSYP